MSKYTDHQEKITTKLIDMITNSAEGTWKMPWVGHDVDDQISARNAKTGVFYKGGNIMSLAMAAIAEEYPTGIWATYRQWQAIGAQVQKNEEASYIVKWIKPKPKDNNEENRGYNGLIPRVYAVHNAAQVEGYDTDKLVLPIPAEPIEAAEEWLTAVGANVRFGGESAYYSPSLDYIQMPAITQFEDPVAYYSTAIHEHGHWTGNKDRLDRDQKGTMGTPEYAKEELVAEMCAAIGCARLGISNEPRPDHALYLKHWLAQLQADPQLLLKSASAAYKAFTYLDDEAGGILRDMAEPEPDHDTNVAEQAA
tara:strand:- start:703 stop:1629 length:927 start_codon:yes stop_codon:yes gene_type:complete